MDGLHWCIQQKYKVKDSTCAAAVCRSPGYYIGGVVSFFALSEDGSCDAKLAHSQASALKALDAWTEVF